MIEPIKNKKSKSHQVNEIRPPVAKTDQEIWSEFLAGSDSAIAEIYAKFVPQLFSYGKQIINNDQLVGDCIQDTFCEVIDKRKKLKPATSVKFYLFASLRRRIFRLLAKERRINAEEISEANGFHYEIDAEIFHISSKLTLDEKKVIEKACNKLSAKQREAINLYFFEGFTYKQIAEIFNFSHPKNARTLIYRALDALYHKLSALKSELLLLLFSSFIS